MANYALVDATGLIVNRILLDNIGGWTAPIGLTAQIEPPSGYQIGGTLVGGVYTAPAQPTVPPSVPSSISDRQFFQQMAVQGIITQDQALASNAAVIPAPLLALIGNLPVDQQFDAKMKISGANIFNRNDPLTIAIGTAYGWNSAQIDAFFVAAALL